MLTDQDRAFLKKLKEKGKSKEEAKSILLNVKKQKTQQASIPEPQKESSWLTSGWDSQKVKWGARKDAASGLLKSAGETVVGGLKVAEDARQALGRAVTPDQFEETLGFSKDQDFVEIASEGLTGKSTEELLEANSPTEKVFKGIGDVAQFAIPAAAATKGVKLSQAAANSGKLAKVGNSVKNALKVGGVDALASAPVFLAREGELSEDSLKETAKNSAIGGAIGGSLNLAGDVLKTGSGLRKWMSEFRANRSVLSDDNIRIAKETSQKVLDDVLEQAKFANANNVRGKTPLDLAGGKMKTALKESVIPARQEVGAKLGAFIDNIETPVQTKGLLDDLTSSLKEQNVKITGEGLVFDDSTFAFSKTSQKPIEELYKKLLVNKEMKGKDLFALTQNVSGLTNLDSMSAEKIASVPEGMLKRLGGKMKETLKDALPEEALPLFDEYGDLAETQNFLAKYTKDTNNAGHLLKRLYSSAKPDGLLGKVDKVSEVSGINLVETTEQAKLAMELAGDTRINSLLGELADKNPDGIKYVQKFFQLIKYTDPERVAKSLSANFKGGTTNVVEEFASVAKDYIEAIAKVELSE